MRSSLSHPDGSMRYCPISFPERRTGGTGITNPIGLVTGFLLVHFLPNALRVKHHPLGKLLEHPNLKNEM